MLGFFPTLYPDETLYSGWARYATRIAYPTQRGYSSDFFGLKKNISLRFLLERRIGKFVQRLPVNHQYSADYLIDHHTLLNLYRFTISKEEFQLAQNTMKDKELKNNSKVNKLLLPKEFLPQYARFCPQCAQEDIRFFGEMYWHRLHQIPGIHVCHKHKCWLEKSDFMIKHRFLKLVSAQETLPKRSEAKSTGSSAYEKLQLLFAENAAWLLENPEHTLFKENIQNKYMNILCEQGLASKTSYRFYQNKIQERVNLLFSTTDFKLIEENIHGTDKVWNSLARKGRYYIQPTTHFYVMYVLGLTIQEVFERPETFGPFGAGPWKCWNPFCNHHEQPVIQRVKLIHQAYYEVDIGLFVCSCGFAYSISEKNQGLNDFQIRRFGSIWRKEVFKITGSNNPSAKTLARCLKIDLPLAKKYKKILQGENDFIKTRDDNRNQCSKLLARYPNLSRQQLARIDKNLYYWFMREDYEWFNKTMPEKWVNGNNAKKWSDANKISYQLNDWEQYDKELAQKIKIARKELLNQPGSPKRISAFGLFEQIQIPYWRFAKKKDKFPETVKVLEAAVETPEKFTARLVQYFVEGCIKHNVIPTERSYLRRFSAQLYNGLSDIYETGYQTILNSFDESDDVQEVSLNSYKFPISSDE